MNLHARVMYGANDHHKSRGHLQGPGTRARQCHRVYERKAGELPSTKEWIDE